MLKVKFYVLLFCIVSCACYSKYCEISPNHVLCKYPVPGPSASCKEYDGNTFLADDDINDLINRINERRNFIAMGQSRRFPGAANMNKIVWSEELATFAQRWVDQCDPTIRPEKEDLCRDLEQIKVGQSIVSILNPSPEFNVKSFIEMWFMKSLDFTGSVSYYDQYKDYSSNQFTQLVWAETKSVGCGRAKFNVNNVVVERLVCNFAPKGNLHGKPVYAIGFPGTQCQNHMIPDETFKGLCIQRSPLYTKFKSTNEPVSSLLRILNLSNDSVKQEIDPIYNNKQINRNTNEMENPRHQIMRHILRNNIMTRRSNTPVGENFRGANFGESPINVMSSHYKEHFQGAQKQHTRLHTTHPFMYQPTKNNQKDDFKGYDLNITPSLFSSNVNYRKHNFNKQCTRRTETQNHYCQQSSTTQCNSAMFYQCTRACKTNCKVLPTRNTMQHIPPRELYPCITYSAACLTRNTQPQYDQNCVCLNENGRILHYPHILRTLENTARSPKISSENYDTYKDTVYKDVYSNPEEQNDWLLNKSFKRSGYVQSNRERIKREFRDLLTTTKPFWQMESFNNDNAQLKSLRYTTLFDRRRPKIRKHSFNPYSTESITLNFEDSVQKLVTEKYLSFDELLQQSARRQMMPILRSKATGKATAKTTAKAKATTKATAKTTAKAGAKTTAKATGKTTAKATTKAGATTKAAAKTTAKAAGTTKATAKLTAKTTAAATPGEEYTANSPFVRLKQCTRRLTCTWTAASVTDQDGNIIPGGGAYGGGTRTPLGYVEGCTRTSTCTRDYMNRNKFPTLTTSNYSNVDESESESDYCERRSLDVEKRDSRIIRSLVKELENRDSKNQKNYDDWKRKRRDMNKIKQSYSLCKNNQKCEITTTNVSYGDIFYLVLRKIIGKWENINSYNQCYCSRATKNQDIDRFLIFSLVLSFLKKTCYR